MATAGTRLERAKVYALIGGAILLAEAAFLLLTILLTTTMMAAVLFLEGAGERVPPLEAIGLAMVPFRFGAAALVLRGAFVLDGPSGRAWAITLLAVGAVSLVTLGGWLVGPALALAGGGLGLAAHRRSRALDGLR